VALRINRTRTRASFNPGLERTYMVDGSFPTDCSTTLGEGIKTARLKKQLTQKELAEAVGIRSSLTSIS